MRAILSKKNLLIAHGEAQLTNWAPGLSSFTGVATIIETNIFFSMGMHVFQ